MYFNLSTEVTGRKEELKLYEQMLQEKFKQMSQPESDNKLEQLTDVQLFPRISDKIEENGYDMYLL
jgi:hypothetical protein